MQVGVTTNSSWLEWFVKTRPTDGRYLKAGPNGTLLWAVGSAAGGGPSNVVYLHDYENSAAGIQTAIDDAANKCLCWDDAYTTNATVTVSAPTYISGVGANALVEGASSEDDRAPASLIASGNLDPMIDIASDGVFIDNMMFDGDATGSTLMRWACKYGRLLGVELKYATTGLEFINQWDYTSIIQCRMMAGLTHPMQIDLNHGSSYNNAHTVIVGSHFSGTHECIHRVAGGSGTAYGFEFFGCDFHDGHSVDYMLDMTNLHYSHFNSCQFELHATDPPNSAVVYCEALGLSFHQCLFGGRDIGAVICLKGGSYSPIDVSGSTFANWFAGQTLMGGGGNFANVDSCEFYNTAAATVMGAGATRGDHTWT